MFENCIELMLSAFYSHSRTIVRMNIDEEVENCLDFLSKLSVTCKIKQENEITVLPVKQLKRGACIEMDTASARLAYFIMGLSLALNISVKINRLSSPVDEKQLKLFAQSLENAFVFAFNGEGIVFSSFCAEEMSSFENIENDVLCAGVILSSPLKPLDSSFDIGKNVNGKYVNSVIDRLKLFSAEPKIRGSILSVLSLYEQKFVKNKNGENTQ